MTPPPPNPDRAARHHAVIDELLSMGMDIARTLHRRITAANQVARDAETAALPPPGHDADAPDLTLQFDRVSRAIRRTVALSRALDAPAEPPARPEAAASRDAARRRIIRAVEDSIHNHAEGPVAAHLRAELAERLDAPDLEDDVLTRPTAAVIADITRDLGIESMQGITRWKRRAPAELAHLAARAARRPGDPPLPEPAPAPEPPPLPRSRRSHLIPLPPSGGQGGAGGGSDPTAGPPIAPPRPAPNQQDRAGPATSAPPLPTLPCPA